MAGEDPVKTATFVCAALLVASTPALADCKSEVDGAFAKLRASKGFRLDTKIVNEQGSLTMSVDYVLPDRMYQRVSLGDSPMKMETIAIGGKAWSNQGQGWVEIPQNYAEMISKQMKESVAEPSKGGLEYTCLGEKEFEGKTYAAYAATLPAVEEKTKGAAAGKPNLQTLYIDKSTGLPARNIVATADAPDKRLFDGTFSLPADLDIKAPPTDR